MHARPRRRQRMEQRRDARPGDIGLGRPRSPRRPAGRVRPGRAARSPRRPGSPPARRHILAIVEEADLARLRRLQRRDAAQHQTSRRRLGLRRVGHRRQAMRAAAAEEPRVPGDRRPVQRRHRGQRRLRACRPAAWRSAAGVGGRCGRRLCAGVAAARRQRPRGGGLAGAQPCLLPSLSRRDAVRRDDDRRPAPCSDRPPPAGVMSNSVVVPSTCARFSTRLMPRLIATCCVTISTARSICAMTYWLASWMIRLRSPNTRRDW